MKKRKGMDPKRSSIVILLKTIWLISFLCVITLASAQNLFVKGIVKDAQGITLSGVTVKIKGTTKVTITDAAGRFELSVPSRESTLSFAFVGMVTKVITVGSNTVFNVTLEDTSSGLSEVVVVGYGTQRKIAITGAVASVGSKEIAQSSSTNLSTALSGKLSGLSALQSDGGQPGKDNSTIYLRGISTLNGATPLFMIDGVPRSDINSININEVESVSILKDASATAVFGVRGANGVVLITTKRGVEGKAILHVGFEQSYTAFTIQPARVHSVDYMNYRNLASTNSGLSALYSPSVIAKYANPLAGLDPTADDYAEQAKIREYMYPDHSYYDELIKKYAPQTNLSVDVSGGTKEFSYFINAGYIHQGGNTKVAPGLPYDPEIKMDRYTFRSNLDYKPTKYLSAFLNLGTYIQQNNMPFAYDTDEKWLITRMIYQATSTLPITPGPTTIAGFGVPAGQIVDPSYLAMVDGTAYETMNGTGFTTDILSNLNSTLGATWDLSGAVTKGLSIKGMASFDAYGGSSYYGQITSPRYACNVDDTNDAMSYALIRPGSALSIGSDPRTASATNYKINVQGSMNYNRTFGKHKVGGMLLAQRDYWDVSGGSSDALIPYNVLGLAGRASYSYDDRYFGEFDMGYNGSEQFAPATRFGFFPAVSLGWVISNERFLAGNNVLTNLKLRASVGKVGNDQMGPTRFLYLDNNTMSYNTMGGLIEILPSLGNGQNVSEGLLGNKKLHWEIAQKQNFGVDFSLFKNLTGSFDYFTEHRTDILLTRSTVPNFMGVASSSVPKVNMGIVDNHGYEMELSYNIPVNKDLSFMVKGNFSYAKNKVKYADEVSNDSTYALKYYSTGYSVGQQFGLKIDWKSNGGYFVSADDIANSPQYESGTPRVGDFKYIDVNGDGVINAKDVVPIGYSSVVPQILYGFTFSTTYKAFDLTLFFQGVANYSMNYSNNAGINVFETTTQGTYFPYMANSWTQKRYDKGEKITYPALDVKLNSNHTTNDFFIMNRSFTRLKNVELGYNLPKNILSPLGISQLRVFAGGQNLFTWDHLRLTQLDPEQSSSLVYPVTMMWNLGCKVTF